MVTGLIGRGYRNDFDFEILDLRPEEMIVNANMVSARSETKRSGEFEAGFVVLVDDGSWEKTIWRSSFRFLERGDVFVGASMSMTYRIVAFLFEDEFLYFFKNFSCADELSHSGTEAHVFGFGSTEGDKSLKLGDPDKRTAGKHNEIACA